MLDFDLRDERAITERLRKAISIPAGSPVVLGIGDDCAIYRPRGSADDLLFTSDLFIEDVHFLRETHKPAEAGRKALARSLSDIAAMGGAPRFCLVALSVPAWGSTGAGIRWVDRFFDGLLGLAAGTGTVLAGGDLSHGEKLACDVTVCGAVPRGTALRRDGARPGDEIYISGTLGGSALGLTTRKGKPFRRHLHPEPRLSLGEFIRTRLRATSAIDLSDGLSLDLRRLCLASNVNAEIVTPPRFPGASLEQALHGGEEYELLFTVRAGTRVPPQFDGLPLTAIGSMVKGEAGAVRLHGIPLPPLGYDHFAPSRGTSTHPSTPRDTKRPSDVN
jgi:thiamine-monophosphate kinase